LPLANQAYAQPADTTFPQATTIRIASEAAATAAIERLSELQARARLVNGRTELVSRYHTSPLKIAKTFQADAHGGPQLAVVQMDGSPGMLEGDRYTFDWHLEPRAKLYVTNQAYTRVHPCSEAGSTKLTQRLKLEEDAVLEWIPEPIMLFKDARFIVDTQVELSERSVCILGEIFSPGRLSRGEAFDFRSYDAKVTVKHNGELIHYQRAKWEPKTLPITNVGCFGSFTHLGSLSVFSDRVTADLVVQLREAMDELTGLPEGLHWGIARTAKYGVVMQAAGTASWKLQRLLLEAWDIVRKLLLGEEPMRLLKEAWMSGTR
jgi:urease accessory protein